MSIGHGHSFAGQSSTNTQNEVAWQQLKTNEQRRMNRLFSSHHNASGHSPLLLLFFFSLADSLGNPKWLPLVGCTGVERGFVENWSKWMLKKALYPPCCCLDLEFDESNCPLAELMEAKNPSSKLPCCKGCRAVGIVSLSFCLFSSISWSIRSKNWNGLCFSDDRPDIDDPRELSSNTAPLSRGLSLHLPDYVFQLNSKGTGLAFGCNTNLTIAKSIVSFSPQTRLAHCGMAWIQTNLGCPWSCYCSSWAAAVDRFCRFFRFLAEGPLKDKIPSYYLMILANPML